jgi:hypothetical protein
VSSAKSTGLGPVTVMLVCPDGGLTILSKKSGVSSTDASSASPAHLTETNLNLAMPLPHFQGNNAIFPATLGQGMPYCYLLLLDIL